MSADWNLLSMIVLTIAAFAVGHVSGSASYNVITVLCGLFVLVVVNGMVAALKSSDSTKEQHQ